LFARIVGRRGFIAAGDGKEIKIPVLIMWGEIDEWIPVAHASLFKQDILNSEVKIYPGVGHCPMEEIPFETSNDAMIFLKKKLHKLDLQILNNSTFRSRMKCI